jgi:hypothetical protein
VACCAMIASTYAMACCAMIASRLWLLTAGRHAEQTNRCICFVVVVVFSGLDGGCTADIPVHSTLLSSHSDIWPVNEVVMWEQLRT